MTNILNEKNLMDPQLTDALASLKLDIFRSLNCVKIGTIQIFDPEKKTAQIALSFKRVLADGTTANYPVLVDCPVFTLQGGGGAIQFPIEAGDECLVLFSDRNIDAWFQNGSAATPFDARAHDLSDGIVLVGLSSLASSLQNYVPNKSRWFYSGGEIDLNAGLIGIKNNTTTLLVLLNGLIDVVAAATLDVGHATLSAPTIAALEAYKLQFAELLE